MNVGFPTLLGGSNPVIITPQRLGFFRVRDVIWVGNISLPSITIASWLYAAVVGDTFLLASQTDPKENGPYIVTAVNAGVATLARHPDWAVGSTQDITTAFISYDGDTWPGIIWRCFATVAGIGTFVVGTNDAPFYPQKSWFSSFVPWTLVNGTKTQTHHAILSAALNPLGRDAGYSVAIKTANGNTLTAYYLVTPTAGVNGQLIVTAKKSDGSTNTADSSTLSVIITNF